MKVADRVGDLSSNGLSHEVPRRQPRQRRFSRRSPEHTAADARVRQEHRQSLRLSMRLRLAGLEVCRTRRTGAGLGLRGSSGGGGGGRFGAAAFQDGDRLVRGEEDL